MKKYKILALLMAMVIILPFALVGCKKKEKAISSGNQILSHKSEFVDFALFYSGIDGAHANYGDKKQSLNDYIDGEAGKNSQVLDDFAKEILNKAGVKDSYLSDYIAKTKNLYVSMQEVSDKAGALYEKYKGAYNQTFLNVIAGVRDDFAVVNSEDVTEEQIFTFASEGLANAVSTAIGVMITLPENMYNLEHAKFYDKTADYNALNEKFKNLYLSAEQVLEVFDFDIMVTSIVNFALADNLQAFIKTKLDANKQSKFDISISTLKTDVKISNEVVKNAYITFMQELVGGMVDNLFAVITSANFDLILKTTHDLRDTDLDVIFDSSDTSISRYLKVMGLCKNANVRQDVLAILDGVGKALQSGFMSDGVKNKIVDSANILNENGIGFFVKRYIDLYRYGIDFVGYSLTQINGGDLDDLYYLAYNDVTNGSHTELKQRQLSALEYKLGADKVLSIYDSYKNKSKLRESFKDNERFDNIIANAREISNAFTRASVTDNNGLNFELVSENSVTLIESKWANIQYSAENWALYNYDYVQNGLNELLSYINPFMELYGLIIG